MYQILLPLHSVFRWLVLAGMVYSVGRALLSRFREVPFSKTDNFSRSFSSGMVHCQLILGLLLYFKSPITTFFRTNPAEAVQYQVYSFFGLVHVSGMLAAVVLVTIGASKAKRASGDAAKHRQVMIWFGIALLIILLSIPWPFHPLVQRPYIRAF